MSIRKRKIKTKELATDFVWMVWQKFRREKLDRCSICPKSKQLKEKEICKGKCEDYGFKDTTTIYYAIKSINNILQTII